MKGLPAGVTVALATPLEQGGELDDAGLDRLLQRVLDAGVVGISPLGSTGEGPRLGPALRHRLVSRVRTAVPAGMPVVAGLAVSTVDAARRELDELAGAGADAVLVSPPSYYPAGDDELTTLYIGLADRSPLPLVIYHIPAMTGVAITPAAVGNLARHPNIIGIKDSSRDLEFLQGVVYATRAAEFDVLTGSDTMLLASLLVGAHGTIAASANLVAELGVAICSAVAAGDLPRAAEIQEQLFAIVQVARRGRPPSGWKATLEIAGVCSARLAEPADRISAEVYATIQRDLAALLPTTV